MTTQEAIGHFNGVKPLADALGMWPQAIYAWGERPPMARQYELEVRTDDNNRTAGVVDSFTEKVLAEETSFPFQVVRERLQWTAL